MLTRTGWEISPWVAEAQRRLWRLLSCRSPSAGRPAPVQLGIPAAGLPAGGPGGDSPVRILGLASGRVRILGNPHRIRWGFYTKVQTSENTPRFGARVAFGTMIQGLHLSCQTNQKFVEK